MKSKLKAILKMNLSDRQRRILIAEDVLGIYGVERISGATGISINHVYAELKVMKESQVRSTYLVLTEDDIKPKDLHVDNTETVTNAHVDNKPQLGINTNEDNNNHYLDIYNIYPKKKDKKRGEQVFKGLIKKGYSKSFLLQCIENYLDSNDNGEESIRADPGKRVRDRDPNHIKALPVLLGPNEYFLEFKKLEGPKEKPIEPFIDEDNSISNLLV